MEALKQQAQNKLIEIQQLIQAAAVNLLDDALSPKQQAEIARKLHRYRVAALLLREITLDSADPTTYRELTLLNKMMAEDEDPAVIAAERTEEEEAAQQRLLDVGINPDNAADLVRLFNALRSATTHGSRPAPPVQ